MSTMIMAPAGLVPLQAPLPPPPQFDLLAAATLVDPANPRWLGGGWTGGDVPGPAHTHDPCATGTDRDKELNNPAATQMNNRFTVYMPASCTAQSIGPNPQFYTARLQAAFQVYEGAAVERVLVSSDGHPALGNYLGDANMEDLGSGSAQTALRAMELLEQEIRVTSGGGIIHATPAVATAWISLYLIEPVRGVMRTKLGTPVAVGAGYVDADPDVGPNAGADQEWAFASGPIEIYRGDIQTVPVNYAEALDRSTNDVLFLAERPYLFNWIARQDSSDEDHVQAGVLVDLTP